MNNPSDMKADGADARKKQLEEANASVKGAEIMKFARALFPHMELRERIIKKAESLVPDELEPEKYRLFWKDQAVLFVQSPPHFVLGLFKHCQEEEAVIAKAMEKRPNSKKRKAAADWLEEYGPTTIFCKLLMELCELRYEYFTESALKFLRNVDLFKGLELDFESVPSLTTAMELAIARSDFNFFARVGDVLRERQQVPREFLGKFNFDMLPKFLLVHWVEEKDGVPALCYLKMSELTNVCSKHLNNKSLTLEAVEKVKQRLGLISLPTRRPQ